MVTHKLEPDASMPRCRDLSAFLGRRCLAEDTPSPKASHKPLRKRSNRVGAPVADSSTFTSQLSIFKLLSKRDPSVQSFGYGVQILTAETHEERVQTGGDTLTKASSCTVSVVHAGKSDSEQVVMAQRLQLLEDEGTELGSGQSAQEPLDTYKVVIVSEPVLSKIKDKDDKEIAAALDQACPQELGESQDRALVSKLNASEGGKAQPSPLVDQQLQAQSHAKNHISSSLQSPQPQERSEIVHHTRSSAELSIVSTSLEELQSLVGAILPQGDANKNDHDVDKSETDTVEIHVCDTITAVEQRRGCMEDKSLLTCQPNKQGQIFEGDIRRSARVKKLFNTVEHNVTDCHKNEQHASKLVVSSSLYDNICKSTQRDFFLPASKKSKKQKLVEETSSAVSDKPASREKRTREEKAVLAQKGTASISSKQVSSSDDFFKPASKRQKQILNTKSDGRLDSMTKEEKGERTSVFEFDLWTEAKVAAEENAQLCVGKATHPFFSQHKSGQRASISVTLPANACSSQQVSTFGETELIPSPPFHVTQLLEGEAHINVGSWTCSRIFENLKVDPAMSMRDCCDKNKKELDVLLRIPLVNKLSKTPMHRRDDPSGRLPLDNNLEPLLTFLKDFDSKNKEIMDQDNTDFSLAYLQDRLKLCLSDRAKRCSEVPMDMLSVCTDEESAQKNLLWTDVYQPQSPNQVCGNRDSVNILSAWLEKWQAGSPFMTDQAERDSTCRKMSTNEDSDEDQDCFQEDFDSEGNTKEEERSQNVLLLAGPVGCGKTAAIYACARAHGFTVIEVNCSENRNGLLIKQKFSESMESHRLGKWSADTTGPGIAPSCTTRDILAAADTNIAENMQPAGSQKRWKQKQKQKQKLNQTPAPTNARTSTSNLSNSKAAFNTDGGSVSHAEQHDGSKESDKYLTVLLFEDVDMVFEDDRGFIAAVAQVAATAKRPIILTSNDTRLCLPHRLGAELLEFKKPSSKELVVLTYLICIAEGIRCRPESLLQMVKLCNHDLRLLLNHLQFWSQGYNSGCSSKLKGMKPLEKPEKEVEMQSASTSQEADSAATTKLFDLEAQHRLWPSCAALEFPCSVTQAVACELNNKISQVEREFALDEEKKLQHLILEKLALMKKLKRQKVDSPLRAERENDSKESAAEESDNWETPVKNLKDAKAVARSPILREKLKKDLAATMFCSAANEEHLDESHQALLKTPSKNECGEDSFPNSPLAGKDVLGAAVFPIAPSPLGTVKTAASPGLQRSEDLTNDVDVETEPMRENVLMKALSQTLTSTTQPLDTFGCDPGESKLQKVSESINALWSEFRETKEKQGRLISSTCKESLATMLFLSELLENLSICDIMSCSYGIEEMFVENSSYPFSCCESLDDSNLLQACSMVADKSFLLCMEQFWASPNIQEEAKVELSIEDMMLAVNNSCALGKLATSDVLLPSSREFKLPISAPSSQEQELKRHDRKSSLYRALYELPSKAQVSLLRASFFEDASFLAKIGLLEQERLISGGTRRRGRVFQNYFRTHPWNLSKESINIIEQFGKFGRSCSADV